jgi:dolichyl-phosphate beta-glucosyltransferase
VSGATLVVPCYNEAARLDGAALIALCDARADLRLVLVDDGSTDGTPAALRAIGAQRPAQVAVLSLPTNAGKAEAVRQGLLAALAGPAETVGFFDADLSTPGSEILRLVAIAEERRVDVVMGARVALLGADIQRRVARHYLGRIFATLVSLLLDLRVYDTQCGAKVFRRSPALAAALETPFRSRWSFDVELLGRLLTGTRSAPALTAADFVEVPLARWHDVPGSKLRPVAMVGMLRELAIIRSDLEARRRAAAGR